MKKILAAALGAGALVTMAGVAPATAAESGAMLSVLHGVPDLTVDVYVNDELTIDDFTPGTLAGPLELPAGTIRSRSPPPTRRTHRRRRSGPSTSPSRRA